MDSRDVYIKRMEAAVLQAGSAITKLKTENAALRRENEILKRKRYSADSGVELDETVAKQQKLGREVEDAATEAEVSSSLVISTASDAESTVESAKAQFVAVRPLLVTVKGASAEVKKRVLEECQPVKQHIGPNKLTYDNSKSRIMSTWAGGEGLLQTEDNDIAEVPLIEAAHTATKPGPKKQASISGITVTTTSTTASVSAATACTSDANTTSKMNFIMANPVVPLLPPSPGSESVMTMGQEQAALGEKKKLHKERKILPERGWDNTFTAGHYSDIKFAGKQFEIKSSVKGIYSTETKKELLPNDTIQLLLANISENNVHIVANSLKKFAPDLVSKHLNDHLRHVAYDQKWLVQQNKNECNLTRVEDDTKMKSKGKNIHVENHAKDIIQYNDDLLSPEYISHIDLLASIIVSIITKSHSGPSTGKNEEKKKCYNVVLYCIVLYWVVLC